MGRPASPPYVLGRITFRPHPSNEGLIQSRGRYRTAGGKDVQVTGSGKTDAAARRDLQAKVEAARKEHHGGDKTLNHRTKVSAAADVWMDAKRRERLAESTMREYGWYIQRVIKGDDIGHRTLASVNDLAVIEAWLSDVADQRGDTAAKQARKVLGGILNLAERRGAIGASVMSRVRTPRSTPGSKGDRKCNDPDCDLNCGKRHLDTRRAFTREEVTRVLAAADASTADVGDLARFLFGTGARISEALHCVWWEGVNWEKREVHIKGTKTASADRPEVRMSDDLVETLRRRAEVYGTAGLVFGITQDRTQPHHRPAPGRLGRPRDRSNVLKALRAVFTEAGVPWAGSHTFRRTVASWLDAEGTPLAEIGNQLGHSDLSVTAGYLGRKVAPTRAAEVMTLPTTTTRGNLHAVSGE